MTSPCKTAQYFGGQDSGVDLHMPIDSPQLGQHVNETPSEAEEQVYDSASSTTA